MINHLKLFYTVGVSVLVLAVCDGAEAQDKTGQEGFTIEEVVVTARRVAENLQDTPVSVSAYTAEALERRQITSTENLDDATPSLQFASSAPLTGNSSAAQVFIRGIGQTDATAGVDPGVALYIDDVYMGSAVGGVMDFRDISGVQVLRGPQGTLFGRNTIGGAILITSKDPGSVFGGTFKAGFGSDNLREASLAVDVPISDTLRTRFTFGTRTRDGYVTRLFDGKDLGDVNSYTLTAKAEWTPNDRFAFKLRGDYTRAKENGPPLVFAAITESAAFARAASFAAGCPGMASMGVPVPMVRDPRCANDFMNAGPFANNGTFPLGSTLENWGASAVAEFKVNDAVTLKSITAYRRLEWSGSRDADNTPLTILHTKYDSVGDQFSQELQGLYTTNRLTGVVGFYYFRQIVDDVLRATLSPPPAPRGTTDSNDNEIRNHALAAFTQWTFKVTDGLSVTGGVRYTEETKGSRPFQYSLSNPSVLYLPHRLFERDFSATTGSASVQYRWNPSVMTYASWSQGFKSGGFNSRFNGVVPSGEPPPFNPETAETVEVGAKLDLNGNLRINADVFSTDYTDLQLTYRVGAAPYLFNAGQSKIEGVEVEFNYVPTPDWVIEGGASYLHDKIKEVATIPGTVTSVTTASQLPYTPEYQANLAIAYSHTLTDDLTLTPRLQVVYTSSQFFDAGNTPEISQTKDVTRLNLGITLESAQGDWRVVAAVNNLTDEVYPIAGNSSLTTGSGYAEVAYDRGREASVSFTKSF